MNIQNVTNAKSTADIIARKVIGEFIQLTFKCVIITLKLKDWNKDYLTATTFTVTER